MEMKLNETQIAAAQVMINQLMVEAHDNAEAHGFYNDINDIMNTINPHSLDAVQRRLYLAVLALIDSEVGEAVHEVQHGMYDKLLEELADIVIRVLDFAGFIGCDFGTIVMEKMKKNRNRPYMHGKKC